MSGDDELRVVDNSNLTDEDWAKINKLKQCHVDGGAIALSTALGELSTTDPLCYFRIMGAFFPDAVKEAVLDSMADAGITESDIRELLAKSQGSRH